MSHLRVKTTYGVEGEWGSTNVKELYCHHNHSCDCTDFYDEKGEVVPMCFQKWDDDNDLWDAMRRLWFPFKDKWFGELKEGVEYYGIPPWELKNKNKDE